MNPVIRLAAEPQLATQRAYLAAAAGRVLDEAIAIQQIPAPTFDEHQRAIYVQERFRGLDAVEVDSLENVYGRLPGGDGASARPALLIAAHTDTVFPTSTPLAIRREGERVYGPGLGDNSLGVAGLLAMLDALRELYRLTNQSLPVDIWFAANTREEGMGNLGGIRAVYQTLASRLGAAIIIEGIALGRIYHAGIAVRRLKITCRTSGGHSWLHFGKPSAIHHLVRVAAQISALQVPSTPRTTFNIGQIEGGQSVNSIAAEASLLLDLRSEDRATLAALEAQVMRLVETEVTHALHGLHGSHNSPGDDVKFTVDVVGDRPSGQISVTHPLVQMASAALDEIGVHPLYDSGSTDANILLAAGLPSVTVGIAHGGNAHRMDEFVETTRLADGLWQLLLLVVSAAASLAQG